MNTHDAVTELVQTAFERNGGQGDAGARVLREKMNSYQTYEQRTAEVLGRYSVSDLIEQTDDDLKRGDEMFYNGKNDLEIINEGIDGAVRYWLILSNDKQYECRRFRNFVYCSCKDFFFRKKVCRHLAFTARVACSNCHDLSAKVGKLCYSCHNLATGFLRPNLQEKNNESSIRKA